MTKAVARSAVSQNKKRIFIVDDHPLIRLSLRQLLDQQKGIEVVGEAGGAPEAISGIRQTQPHLVILDLTLRDGDGMDLLKEISSQWPQIKLLVASMHNEPIYVERAMRAGASGYVTKAQPAEELIAAVQTIFLGRLYINPELSDALMRRSFNRESDLKENPINSLSDRELQVFDLLGGGKSTREIAEKLMLSVKTIETYRENIKQKLSLQNGNELMYRAVSWKIEIESQ